MPCSQAVTVTLACRRSPPASSSTPPQEAPAAAGLPHHLAGPSVASLVPTVRPPGLPATLTQWQQAAAAASLQASKLIRRSCSTTPAPPQDGNPRSSSKVNCDTLDRMIEDVLSRDPEVPWQVRVGEGSVVCGLPWLAPGMYSALPKVHQLALPTHPQTNRWASLRCGWQATPASSRAWSACCCSRLEAWAASRFVTPSSSCRWCADLPVRRGGACCCGSALSSRH